LEGVPTLLEPLEGLGSSGDPEGEDGVCGGEAASQIIIRIGQDKRD